MTSTTGYLQMRRASEAGLISEILRVLSNDAKRVRAQSPLAAGRVAAVARRAQSAGERAGSAQRELRRTRRPLAG